MSTEIFITVCHNNSGKKTYTFNSLHIEHISVHTGLFINCDLCVYQELFLGLLTSALKILNPVQSHHLGLLRSLLTCLQVSTLVRVPAFKSCISVAIPHCGSL